MNKKIASIVFAFMLIMCFGFCFSCDKNNDSEKKSVAVSIVPEATFVKAVCGDNFNIVTAIPAGYNPETYEPTVLEMASITSAQAYFSIGVPAEENILKTITDNSKIVSLADAAAEQYSELTLNGGRDPHVWLSIKRVKVMVDKICEVISKIDPDNSSVYKANAASYKIQLNEADTYVSGKLKNLSNKKFIVFHPAFGYFASDYGLEMYAIEREGSEATADDLKNMIDFAKANKIKVVFNQAEVDDSWITSFTQQIEGGSFKELSPLSGNYITNLKSMADAIASSNQE